MNGVLDLVREFHIFNGGKGASDVCWGGSCHGGCWRDRVAMVLLPVQVPEIVQTNRKDREGVAAQGRTKSLCMRCQNHIA